MKLNFTISEFNISGQDIPQQVCDKILKYHILPMQPVREELGYWVTPSENSGYRSIQWELDHGRSGGSQHTFKGNGATDWTCKDFKNNKDDLLNSIIKHTDYTRMTIYNSFIHCDYKHVNKRQVFESGADSVWVFKKFV